MAMLTVTRQSAGLTASLPVKVFGSYHPPLGCSALERPPDVGLPINMHLIGGADAYPPHKHDHYEITFIVDGRGIHETQFGQVEVGPGSVHVLAPGEMHCYREADALTKVKCAYLGEWLLNDLHELLSEGELIPLFMHTVLSGLSDPLEPPQWQVPSDVWEECARELGDIVRETAREHPSLIRMKSALKKMMVLLDRSFSEWGGQLVIESESAPWMRRALQRVEETILQGESLDLASIAKELDMTVKAFSRSFHQFMGSSPTEYFQHRRVQRACWMLLHSGRNITEVAHILGYSDSAHFTRMFRRMRGETPSDYRVKYHV